MKITKIALIILMIVLAGIYKFNFTNDDIFVELENGKVVNIDSPEAKEEAEK